MRVLTRWDDQFTTEETNEILTTLALEILRETPECAARERIIAGLASRDYSFLCNADLAYEELSASTAIDLRQCLAFFTKRKDIDIGVDKRHAALCKWLEAESACSETNTIFKLWSAGRYQFPRRVESIFHMAQRKISKVLGGVPSFEDIRLRFGPGATTQVKKRNASARQKLSEAYACSEEFLGCIHDALQELPAWAGLHYYLDESGELQACTEAQCEVAVHAAKLDFVPKNAKIERAIGVEPSLNSMFQLGVGSVIARGLLRSGIDLRDQSKNQRLAREGSLTGALATLDLSSASDTIATELVAHLLPLDWFFLLQRLRTGTMVYGPTSLKLQKFSSMGNGFTFPLETLIFFSLAHSCCLEVLGRPPLADEISVYGDDIIVPTTVVPLLSEVLHCAGFTVNAAKSFSSGPFRESCGKDYLTGIDIRPCYVKDALDGPSLFVLHNFFVRNMRVDLAASLRQYLNPCLQIFGPDGYGDGHLLGNWQPVPHRRVTKLDLPNAAPNCPPVKDWQSARYCSGWSGYTFDTFTLKARRSYRPLPGDAILPSYSIYASGASSPVQLLAETSPSLYRGGFLRSQDRDFLRSPEIPDSAGQYTYDGEGRLGVVIPGSKGYKRISIYTLAP